MALINNYHSDQFGITMMDCYWKIELYNGISGGKELLRVRMNCFKDKATADANPNNKYGDFDFEFVPDLSLAQNFIMQAYLYAKTLPQFAGAIDA